MSAFRSTLRNAQSAGWSLPIPPNAQDPNSSPNHSPSPIRLLLVEDDPAHAQLIKINLDHGNQAVATTVAESLSQARHLLSVQRFDLLIVDSKLYDGCGLDLLESNSSRLDLPVIVMTSHGDEELAVKAMRLGALDYLIKSPQAFEEIGHTIERAVREWANIQLCRQAEVDVQQAHQLLLGVLDSLTNQIAVLDEAGEIVFVNVAWKLFTIEGCLGGDAFKLHANYLSCLQELNDTNAVQLANVIRSMLDNQIPAYCFEYGNKQIVEPNDDPDILSLHSSVAVDWFEVRLSRMIDEGNPRIVVCHSDISVRKRSEQELRQRTSAVERIACLSKRERQVMVGVACGKANKVIAKDLDLSPKTIEKHRGNLMRKLKVRSVAELVRLAVTADPLIGNEDSTAE